MAENVKITPPDYTLRQKVGGSLEGLFTAQIVESAEKIIQETDETFLREALAQTEALEAASAALQKAPDKRDAYLPTIISAAFSIKTKVVPGGYGLVSALAKSLHVLCEAMQKAPLTDKHIEIIQWHVASIRILLKGGLKGDGGPTGAAIVDQLQALAPAGVLLCAEE